MTKIYLYIDDEYPDEPTLCKSPEDAIEYVKEHKGDCEGGHAAIRLDMENFPFHITKRKPNMTIRIITVLIIAGLMALTIMAVHDDNPTLKCPCEVPNDKSPGETIN